MDGILTALCVLYQDLLKLAGIPEDLKKLKLRSNTRVSPVMIHICAVFLSE